MTARRGAGSIRPDLWRRHREPGDARRGIAAAAAAAAAAVLLAACESAPVPRTDAPQPAPQPPIVAAEPASRKAETTTPPVRARQPAKASPAAEAQAMPEPPAQPASEAGVAAVVGAPSIRFRSEPEPIDDEVEEAGQEIDRGTASWYGLQFHGRQTANGERYNMYALTAAHKTLPFGTIVRVRNLQSGRSVDVRINDRGPYVQGRVIDLSKAAADELGMVDQGLKPVSLTVTEWPQDVKETARTAKLHAGKAGRARAVYLQRDR